MPLSSLHRAAIQLASEDEALRPDLLGLLRTARMREVSGKVIAGDKVRITIGEGGRDNYVILIEELPTKPVKRKLQRLTYNAHYVGKVLGMWEFLAVNVAMHAKFNKSMSFEQAKSAVTDGMFTMSIAATKRAHKMWEDKDPAKGDQLDDAISKNIRGLFSTDEVYFLEVEPADYTAMDIKGKGFTVDTQWNSFSAVVYDKNNGPQSHEPSYTKMVSKSPAAARKFFKMMKAAPDVLNNVTWSDFDDWLNRAKIPFSYQFSQWR